MEMAPPSLPHHADSCSRLSSRTGGVPDPIVNSFISLTGNGARSVMDCEQGFENPANFTWPGAGRFRKVPRSMQIHPNQKGNLPHVEPPIPFQTLDGRLRGWKVVLP